VSLAHRVTQLVSTSVRQIGHRDEGLGGLRQRGPAACKSDGIHTSTGRVAVDSDSESTRVQTCFQQHPPNHNQENSNDLQASSLKQGASTGSCTTWAHQQLEEGQLKVA
jgi:hypothetical protein